MQRASLIGAIGAAAIAGVASAALIGINFSNAPLIQFLSNGSTSYDAFQERFEIHTCPTAIFFDDNGSPAISFVTGDEGMDIELRIRNDGALIAGVANGPDLLIEGDVQVPNGPLLSGVLLTGEILEYGSLDLSGEPNDDGTDFFDFRFSVTGGLLANPYFTNADIGLQITSEASTFVDDFNFNFAGGAKGTVGPIERTLGENCCANDAKPRAIELVYTGDDCAATTNLQDGKFECIDFGVGALPECVFVVAAKEECNDFDSKDVYFMGEVCIGESFVVDAANLTSPEDKLASKTYICIFAESPFMDGDGHGDFDGHGDGAGLLLQEINIHTSCSEPLVTGDQFASTLLIDCTSEDEAVEGSCCNFGKPRLLTMEYTGDDCSATVHGQDSGKVNCEDFAALTNSVFIRATEKENPNDTGGKIWFEGTVADGQLYDLDAANAGENDLSSSTYIHIFDGEGGPLLQSVEFHTSCSQPLVVGDQFGASLLVDCIGSDEPIPGDCCAAGKPAVLEMLYNGDDCEFTNHSQDDGKVTCFGDPDEVGTVYIIANEKENPSDGKIWFAGSVDLDTPFLISAANAGSNELASSTWIHIFDAQGGTEIQTIQFHTSCSQPLHLGDQFGATVVIDCIDDEGNQAPTN